MEYSEEKLKTNSLINSMKIFGNSSDKNSSFFMKYLTFNCGKPMIYRLLLIFLFLLIILIFRGYFICLFGFVNCYITWPFLSPKHIHLDLLNLSMNDETTLKLIPRRIHHILIGSMSQSPPLNWLKARNSCLEIHSNSNEFFFWNDENSEEFLIKNYPWFLKTWNSYKTIVQKADALRYFVLYHYGGIFLDMDLFCRHSLNGLLNYLDQQIQSDQQIFFAVKAFPVGISNGFMITTKNHPLLKHVIENLESYNLNFLIHHATIVISTGPMFISIQIQLNRSLWNSILVLDGKENMLGGKIETPLFKHYGSGSWHQADETIFKNIPMNIQHQSQTFSLSILIFLFFSILLIISKNRNSFKVNSKKFKSFFFFFFLFFLEFISSNFIIRNYFILISINLNHRIDFFF